MSFWAQVHWKLASKPGGLLRMLMSLAPRHLGLRTVQNAGHKLEDLCYVSYVTMFCCKGQTCVVHLREINQSLRYERLSFCISRREKVKLNRLTAGVKRLNLLWPRSHFYFMGLLWMKCRPFTAGAVTRQSDAELRKRSRGGKEMREIYEWSLGSTRPRGSEAVRAVPPNTEINQSCAPPPTLGSPPTPSAPSQGCGGRH